MTGICRSGLGHYQSTSGLAKPSSVYRYNLKLYAVFCWYDRKHWIFYSPSRGALFSEKKDELPEKHFADPCETERLRLSLSQTLTVKLPNHGIVLWYFVLCTLEISSL